jgi:glycine/D-amino acid oxidase-like deaminating enzyme
MPTSDVIVVGGGVNGVAIAFNLARRGVQVTLVERESIAAGPTGRACGIIRQHYSHEVTARMALKGLRIFQNFDDVVGGTCDFRQTGCVIPVGPQDVSSLEANVALQQAVGVDTRLISLQELAELEPHADFRGIAAAAYEPEAGYADAYSTANAYAQRARELGTELLTGTRVLSVIVEGGRAQGVSTDGGPLSAGTVVLAAGPWSRQLGEACGVELPLTAARVQVGLFNRTPRIERHGVVLDTKLGIYTRPEADDLMLVGSLETSEAEHRVEDPDRYPESADFDRISHYSNRIVERYPAMSGASFRNGYASLYDVSPDWQPVLDELPGVENLYCAAGSSGHGFKLAPVVGEMMADLVIDGKDSEDDISLFSFDRFAAEASLAGRYDQKILG